MDETKKVTFDESNEAGRGGENALRFTSIACSSFGLVPQPPLRTAPSVHRLYLFRFPG